METYVAILRGINVSGQKSVKMEELRKLCESLGFQSVKTYIQSGNVIFKADKSNIHTLQKLLENGIQDKFGFEVPVIVLEEKDLARTVAHNPFLQMEGVDIERLYVTFLAETPTPENLKKLEGLVFAYDEFAVMNREIYLYCPSGYGSTKLSNNFFENKLKVKATTRNWKTVNVLYGMAK